MQYQKCSIRLQLLTHVQLRHKRQRYFGIQQLQHPFEIIISIIITAFPQQICYIFFSREQALREPRFQPRTSQRNYRRGGSDRLQLGSGQFFQRRNGGSGREERSVAGSRGRGGYGAYRSGGNFQTACVMDLSNY
ncbi:Hypothetical_protein [Hexamita inflata]|uniref:Hypothetical_protein n=1 Tax=Hexamita inflata TaxID=28002 RepID=A0AA86PIF2_9EUKA|nr:Hypothetical protein HINF_LOCUS27736 [Hexamita inflata]CAI9940093.1 Hypothetical protein HINF_LOCUS27738 [Hexamita inflata]CAI9940094.1 Hypothetical protein HINF_LOCUS27739 [Hexamita inflata]